jgi:hypothetical protein
MKQTAQDAFIAQTYGSLENAKMADKMADEASNQNVDLKQISAAAGHSFGEGIRACLNIPTKNPVLTNDNSKYTSHYKNYDHSLEKPRIKFGDGGEDGVEWGDAHDNNVGNWEIGE